MASCFLACPMPSNSVAIFIEAVSRLGLLEKPQLEEFERAIVEKYPDVQALAAEVLHRGWLTHYQLEQVLKGQGQQLLIGQYVLLEPLGEGGMGQVFKARQHRLNRTVALKIIHEERLMNSDATRRFYREIQAAAQLSHPNIVLA